MAEAEHSYVGRGGLKLRHALEAFGVDPQGWICADLGANVGGFTDCLLQAGAARVYAVDTGYGTLAWKLRSDPRVVVMERTNALHVPPPQESNGSILMDLVAIDLGWTPQRHALPAAAKWLKRGGVIITLIKPHYELSREESRRLLKGGIMAEADAEQIAERTLEQLPALGLEVRGFTRSPIQGGAGKGKRGNAEWLALVAPTTAPPPAGRQD
jgi:23S rRNA (cytidine1920-2'-O)/16S rRNA (cytidine1409-2'-O)-methyltransferase